MANVHKRYNFPTGEFVMTSKLTDLKSENSDVLTTTDMVGSIIQTIEKRINNGGETFIGKRELTSATDVVMPQFSSANILADQQFQQQTYFPDNSNIRHVIGDVDELKSNSDGWIGFSMKAESTADPNNDNLTWEQLNNEGIGPSNVRLPIYCPVPMVDIEMRQPEEQPPDVFPSFENVASNDFDLLSYLCEGDNSSQGDCVSTDSSHDIKCLPKTTNTSTLFDVLPKTYEPVTSSITSVTDNSESALNQVSDVFHSQESPNSAISSTSSAPPISTRSSSHRIIERPETPEESSIKQRLKRPRHVDINSNCSRSEVSRGKGRKRLLSSKSESDDDNYRDTREKNNEASRKSRINKKAKEQEMSKKAIELEKDNRILKMKVEELEKLVSSIRNALLRSALKKEIKSNNF